MDSKEQIMDKWQGEGWYTERVWVHMDGSYAVDNWENPEAPEAFWAESELDFREPGEGEELVVEYLGDGAFPNEPVAVADGYDDFDYGRWDDVREAVRMDDDAEAAAFIAGENAGRTHAGFRALRESIGLSQSDVADVAGVQERTVRRWEAPGNAIAPADAWHDLERMRETFRAGVSAALSQVAEITDEAGRPPRTVALSYYRSQSEYDELGRDDGPYGFRNAMTREVARRLEHDGLRVVVKFFGE